MGAFVVLGGTARFDELLCKLESETPVCLEGMGGGGIDESVFSSLWGLLRAGNAGGESVSSPSSSEAGGEITSTVGQGGADRAPLKSQS